MTIFVVDGRDERLNMSQFSSWVAELDKRAYCPHEGAKPFDLNADKNNHWPYSNMSTVDAVQCCTMIAVDATRCRDQSVVGWTPKASRASQEALTKTAKDRRLWEPPINQYQFMSPGPPRWSSSLIEE